jgi:glycerophosphoryl diester phosphodiesterase
MPVAEPARREASVITKASAIRFAHRGAPVGPAAGNTLEAFEAALRAGAEGIESDVRLTADGVPVLVHGLGRVQGRPLRTVRRADLPPQVPSLADVWERCGLDFELALDMSDPGAAEAVLALGRHFGAEDRLWLTYWRLPLMAAWRQRWPDAKLVYATMLGVPGAMLRRTASHAAAAGVDALNLHHRLVGGGSAATVHAAGLRLFAWGLRDGRQAQRVTSTGADALFLGDVR